MMTFWILTAGLIGLALLFVAPSLLSKHNFLKLDRDAQNIVIAQERLAELEVELSNGKLTQAVFDQTKLELEQALIIDLDTQDTAEQEIRQGRYGQITLLAVLVFIPVFTGLVYLKLGKLEMASLTSDQVAQIREEGAQKKKDAPSIEEMIAGLEKKLAETPDNGEGWYMLGRTMMALKKYEKATVAYANAHRLLGNVPQVMLSLADAEAMTQKGDMSGRPKQLILAVLKQEPDNTTALWLAGIVANIDGDIDLALKRLTKLHGLFASSPDEQLHVANLIKKIQTKNNLVVSELALSPEKQTSKGQAEIHLRVSLSDDLLAKASPDDLVFIYAKAINGPRFPLAAARFKVSDLPLEITLDDSKAMMPSAKLSGFPQVTVGARVSKSGQPIARSGDFSAELSPISVVQSPSLTLVIDKILP